MCIRDSDEPTNHLDADTRDLVARTLAEYRGTGLLVSHDRGLLDGLATSCVFVDQGRAVTVPGSYSQAKEQIDLRRRTLAEERANARRELDVYKRQRMGRLASHRAGLQQLLLVLHLSLIHIWWTASPTSRTARWGRSCA